LINVTEITVYSFDLQNQTISWKIAAVSGPSVDTTPHQIFDYEFSVLRSENPASGYIQLGNPLTDVYTFTDTQVSLLHKWREYFYKIRVTHKVTGETKDFGPTGSKTPERDLIAAEIVRQEGILFQEFIGRRCWLFQMRTFGPRCSCFDMGTGKITRGSHGPCFGTGWLGGYHAPIEVYIQIDPSQKAIQQSSPHGEAQMNNCMARMSNYPPVSPRDIIVESENRRWRVVSVGATERLRHKIHQELQLHEIPRGDIEFLLPLSKALLATRSASSRNFTGPKNIDGDDYSDLIATYGGPKGSAY